MFSFCACSLSYFGGGYGSMYFSYSRVNGSGGQRCLCTRCRCVCNESYKEPSHFGQTGECV